MPQDRADNSVTNEVRVRLSRVVVLIVVGTSVAYLAFVALMIAKMCSDRSCGAWITFIGFWIPAMLVILPAGWFFSVQRS